ncbi:MAG: sensor histidine kinase [Sphingobacteriales bacterium]
MKKIFTCIALLVIVTSVFAQKKQIDSLKKALRITTVDTSRVNLLVELSKQYYLEKPDSGLIYASQALEIAKRTGDKQGEAHALTQVGFSIWLLGDLPNALQTFISSQKIATAMNDQWSIARNYDGMSCIYATEGETKTAVDYAYKSEAIFRKIHDYQNVVDELMDIAGFYTAKDNLDTTLAVGRKALALSVKINEVRWRSQILTGIGNAYFTHHNTKLGLAYLYEGLAFAELYNQPYNLTNAYYPLELAYRKLGNRDSCIYFAKKEFEESQTASFYFGMAESSAILAEQYYGNNDHEAARYYKIATTIKDSLFNADKAKQVLIINIAEQQHAADLKAAAIAYQGKLKLWGVLIALILVVAILLVLWRNNRQKQKANYLLSEQKEEIETQRDNLGQALDELKNTQTQLVQREKMASLGELTAGIAHEIQNPLNFVNNFSDVNQEMLVELKEELDKGDIEEAKAIASDLQDNEKKINHHGKRADAIVKGMLQHSKTGGGVKEPVNINALAEEYMRLSYHGLSSKDQSFHAETATHFDQALPKINVIPQDMGKVFFNLFNNAFYAVNQKANKAGPDYRPSVEVSTTQQNGSVIISVKDNGNGIPEGIREKIMQPFFTTKPTGDGTGLGLSLSYDMVVKGHGGKIDVNTKEGEFTEFIVTLPI